MLAVAPGQRTDSMTYIEIEAAWIVALEEYRVRIEQLNALRTEESA